MARRQLPADARLIQGKIAGILKSDGFDFPRGSC
jgi:hypothetical protein